MRSVVRRTRARSSAWATGDLGRFLLLGMAVTLALAAGPSAFGGNRLTAKVNPFVGTGGHGHTFPGATLPFGLVQLSPDTRLTGWDGCSGYHHSDSRIFGFSHTHLSGTGISDYGDVLLMPATGTVRLHNGADGKPGYASSFSHEREWASPGFYAVDLLDSGVHVELTATMRTGLHRYVFPRGRPGHVVLDLSHRDEVLASALRVVGPSEVEGFRRSRAWARDQPVHFVIRFSKPIESRGIAIDGRAASTAAAEGKDLRAFFGFGDAGGDLLVKVGISAVSVEGARKNLDAELPGWDFALTRRQAEATWEGELGKIRVRGGDPRAQRIFYTALYHSLLSPNVFSDVDGRYLGRDGGIHEARGFDYLTVFSLWDTFRALHPLLTLIHEKRTVDTAQTFLRQYQEGGRLPVWELWGNETDTMIGYHAVPVLADAILKGVSGFDRHQALLAMKASAEGDRYGLGAYRRLGYVPAHEEPESASKTLEYAYDDWCIARVAALLGEHQDAERYLRRSLGYRHLFDPATGFLRARYEGGFVRPFDPAEVNFHYTEANAWQYSFFVPHDVNGLMDLHGGPEALASKLDALFEASSRLTGREQADITGLVGQYAHGNEPSHHMAYLYAFAGQPWKTQALVRRILDTLYADAPDGLAGNEDCGQMSAWYVLSALGFYPVTPGSNEYVLGTPLFPEVRLALPGGKSLVVRAPGISKRAFYVQGLRLNGRPYRRGFLSHEDLLKGGVLEIRMGPAPSRTAITEAPRAAVAHLRFLPAPVVVEGEAAFEGSTSVRLAVADPKAGIHVSWDGSDPSATSPAFVAPVTLRDSSVLKAAAFREGFDPSPVTTQVFHRRSEGVRVTLESRYAPQYSAGGDQALVDGLRGRTDFRVGRWQGFLGQDLEAVVDLGHAREIRRLALGTLQDVGAWILLPPEVAFAVSADGVSFEGVGTARPDVTDRQREPLTRDLAVTVPAVNARFVRVTARGYGPLPPWHPGAGEPSWIFADEIIIE